MEMPPPPWQPDDEVSQCPVCNVAFHFFNRKHHCRKCGRVVCAACSPHRITLLRQNVVRAPDEIPVMSGGEKVRVCKPCVPDPMVSPWTPPAAWETTGGQENTDTERRPARDMTSPFRYYPRQQNTNTGPTLSRSVPQNHPRAAELWRTLVHPSTPPRVRTPPYLRPPELREEDEEDEPTPRQSPRAAQHGYRHSENHISLNEALSAFPQRPTAPPSPPRVSRRRQVKEEDECPVCGNEMPVGESAREAHIQQCISDRFSSSSTAASHTFTTTASSSTPPRVPIAPRPRATSYRPRGMAVYKATEKDCQDEDGDPQECIICFEEFQEGDEMGRMECLCKFHKACIRGWWDTKGVGSCPTHQLHT